VTNVLPVCPAHEREEIGEVGLTKMVPAWGHLGRVFDEHACIDRRRLGHVVRRGRGREERTRRDGGHRGRGHGRCPEEDRPVAAAGAGAKGVEYRVSAERLQSGSRAGRQYYRAGARVLESWRAAVICSRWSQLGWRACLLAWSLALANGRFGHDTIWLLPTGVHERTKCADQQQHIAGARPSLTLGAQKNKQRRKLQDAKERNRAGP
jgi:hypothetical protein